jgi:hypothetical protein
MADAPADVRTTLATAAHLSHAAYSAADLSVPGATSWTRVNHTLQGTAAAHGFEPGRFLALARHSSQDAVVVRDGLMRCRYFVPRGTATVRDFVTDVLGFALSYSRRLDTTTAAARAAHAEAVAAGDDFVVVGHSLGGILAHAIGALLHVPSVALNAPLMRLTGPESPVMRGLADVLFPWPGGTSPPPHITDAELSAGFASMSPGAAQAARLGCDGLSAVVDLWGLSVRGLADGDALSFFTVQRGGTGAGTDSCHAISTMAHSLPDPDARVTGAGARAGHPSPTVDAARLAFHICVLRGLTGALLSTPGARCAALRALPRAASQAAATAALAHMLTKPLQTAATAGSAQLLAAGAAGAAPAFAAGGAAAHALAGLAVAVLRGDDADTLAAARSLAPSVLLSAVFGAVVMVGRGGFAGTGPQYASYFDARDQLDVGLPGVASGGVHIGVVTYVTHDGTTGTMRVVGAHAELLGLGAAVRFGGSTESSWRTFVDGEFTFHVYAHVTRSGQLSAALTAGDRVLTATLPALGPTRRYSEVHKLRTDGRPHMETFTPGAGTLSLTAPAAFTYALPDGRLRTAAVSPFDGAPPPSVGEGAAVGSAVATASWGALMPPLSPQLPPSVPSLPPAFHVTLHERTVAELTADLAGRLGTRVQVFDMWQSSERKSTPLGTYSRNDRRYYTGKVIKTDMVDVASADEDDAGGAILLHNFNFVAVSEDYTDCIGRKEFYTPPVTQWVTKGRRKEHWVDIPEGTSREYHEGTTVELQRDQVSLATFEVPAVTAGLPVRDGDGVSTTTDTISQTLHRITTSQAAGDTDPSPLINSETSTAFGTRSVVTVFDPVQSHGADGTVTTTLRAETQLGSLEVVYTHPVPEAGGGSGGGSGGGGVAAGDGALALSPLLPPSASLPSVTTVTPILVRTDTTAPYARIRWGMVDRGSAVTVEIRYVGDTLPDGAAHRYSYFAQGVDETGGFLWVTRQPWSEERAGESAAAAAATGERRLAPTEYYLAPAAERFIAGLVGTLVALHLHGAAPGDIVPAIVAGLESAVAAVAADVVRNSAGDPLLSTAAVAASLVATSCAASAHNSAVPRDVAFDAAGAAGAAAVRLAAAAGAIPEWARLPLVGLHLPLRVAAVIGSLFVPDATRAYRDCRAGTWSRELQVRRGLSGVAGSIAGMAAPMGLYAAFDVVAACAPLALSSATGAASTAAAAVLGAMAAPAATVVGVAAVSAATAAASFATRSQAQRLLGVDELQAQEVRAARQLWAQSRAEELRRKLDVKEDATVEDFCAQVVPSLFAGVAAKGDSRVALATVADIGAYVGLRVELGHWAEFTTDAVCKPGQPAAEKQPAAALCALTLLGCVHDILKRAVDAADASVSPTAAGCSTSPAPSPAQSPPAPPPAGWTWRSLFQRGVGGTGSVGAGGGIGGDGGDSSSSLATASPASSPSPSPSPAPSPPCPVPSQSSPPQASAQAQSQLPPSPSQSQTPMAPAPSTATPSSRLTLSPAVVAMPVDAYIYVALLAGTVAPAAAGTLAAWQEMSAAHKARDEAEAAAKAAAAAAVAAAAAAAAAVAQPSRVSRILQAVRLQAPPGSAAAGDTANTNAASAMPPPADSATPAGPSTVEQARRTQQEKEAAWMDSAVPPLRLLLSVREVASLLLDVYREGEAALKRLRSAWPPPLRPAARWAWKSMPNPGASAGEVERWVSAMYSCLVSTLLQLPLPPLPLPPLLSPLGVEIQALLQALLSALYPGQATAHTGGSYRAPPSEARCGGGGSGSGGGGGGGGRRGGGVHKAPPQKT